MKSFYLIRPYFVQNWLRIVIGLCCLVVVDFMQLFIPRVVKQAVDALTVYQAAPSDLLRFAGTIVALAIGIGVFRYIWRRCLIGLSRLIEERLRNRLFDHLQTLSADYFDRTPSGDLMARATNDIQHVRMAAGMGMVALTDSVVLGTAAVAFMAYINLQLTLFVLIPMPGIVLCTRFFGKKMHRRYQNVQAAFSTLTEAVRERLAGIRLIKAFNRHDLAHQLVDQASRDYIDENIRLVRITRSFFPMMMFFSNLSMAVVIFLGGRQTIFAAITPGDFVAFISYLGLLTWPMMALGWLINLIQRGKASLDRIAVILQTEPRIGSHENPLIPERIGSDIQLNGVDFAYPAATENGPQLPVLKQIDLVCEAGQTLGIVGPPGSGKTSLLNVIARIYDVSAGQVRIGGHDIRRLALDKFRALISFVPQEPFLFAGTIGDNITFFDPVQDRAALQQVLRAAALDDTIRQFPHGLATIVGEKGVILSGGQKQRVALARAFFNPAPILILDDPVSQVDAATGDRIVRAIRRLGQKHTVIIATHRLSAVRHAHQTVVLENGQITESGTHTELMAIDGYYARTVRLQEVERELDAA